MDLEVFNVQATSWSICSHSNFVIDHLIDNETKTNFDKKMQYVEPTIRKLHPNADEETIQGLSRLYIFEEKEERKLELKKERARFKNRIGKQNLEQYLRIDPVMDKVRRNRCTLLKICFVRNAQKQKKDKSVSVFCYVFLVFI
jgi:hypothetical protein